MILYVEQRFERKEVTCFKVGLRIVYGTGAGTGMVKATFTNQTFSSDKRIQVRLSLI
jgi:hypothetical protein